MQKNVNLGDAKVKKKANPLAAAGLAIVICGVIFAVGVIQQLMFPPVPRDGDEGNVVVIPSQTAIPMPTNTLIPAEGQNIDAVFAEVNGVIAVEVSYERDMGQQIGAFALLTISPDSNLMVTRNAIWNRWAYHAQLTYSFDKRLVLDLTISQNGLESIWQRTSDSQEWLHLGGILPTAPVVTAAPTIRPIPANCSTAVAMNMPADEAARAGLDSDGDGVACYGD